MLDCYGVLLNNIAGVLCIVLPETPVKFFPPLFSYIPLSLTHTQPLPHQPLKPVKATITANASQLQSLAEDGKHHSDAAVRQRLPDLNESVEASQTR